ncbi:MAG: tRNA pseudouridine(54/55) synthase Pus10 [Candidatus Micrarchaeota archaeon]
MTVLKSRSRSSKLILCAHCAARNGLKASNGACSICNHRIFGKAGKLIKLAKQIAKAEFHSFSISSRIPRSAEISEEELWDRVGISRALSLKTQLNSEILTQAKRELGKEFSPDSPDVTFLFDFENSQAEISISPLFLYAHYRKFSREMSQTKWPCDCKNGCEHCKGTFFKYQSVEELVEKPLLKAFRARGAKFHGAGREDVDARMLGSGRPFVVELEEPLVRTADLPRLENEINIGLSGKVEISNLSFTMPRMVEMLKEARLEKSYRALVQSSEPIRKSRLARIPRLLNLKQQTPNRVLHRRSDLERARWVRIVSLEQLGPDTLELTIDTESGTYVKEFISGDDGRTKPSLSEFLGSKTACRELDVIGIRHSFISDYW